MTIVWSPEAIEDLISLRATIAKDSPPYRVQGDAIQILRVYHGARPWPESF
jgi:plasmid stabilization system protein ParE